MFYLVLFEGEGGCGDTIGCNRTWRFIKAESKEEALQIAVKQVFGDWGIYQDNYIDSLFIMIDHYSMDWIYIIEYNEFWKMSVQEELLPLVNQYKEEIEKEKIKKEELDEYLRLKAKYGDL